MFGQSQVAAEGHLAGILTGILTGEQAEGVGIGAAGGFDDLVGGVAEIEHFLAGLFAEDDGAGAAAQVQALDAGAEGVAGVHGGGMCGVFDGFFGGCGSLCGGRRVFCGLRRCLPHAMVHKKTGRGPDLGRNDLEGADGAVGKVGVNDVKSLLGEQPGAGFAGGFDVAEGAAGCGEPNDFCAVQRGFGGKIVFAGPHEEGDVVAAPDEAIGKLACDDAGTAGMVFKHKVR